MQILSVFVKQTHPGSLSCYLPLFTCLYTFKLDSNNIVWGSHSLVSLRNTLGSVWNAEPWILLYPRNRNTTVIKKNLYIYTLVTFKIFIIHYIAIFCLCEDINNISTWKRFKWDRHTNWLEFILLLFNKWLPTVFSIINDNLKITFPNQGHSESGGFCFLKN